MSVVVFVVLLVLSQAVLVFDKAGLYCRKQQENTVKKQRVAKEMIFYSFLLI
tara:strand:- start:326 stop:481 length:156 start_codon:yes stop_codon:yes gene_type:complete